MVEVFDKEAVVRRVVPPRFFDAVKQRGLLWLLTAPFLTAQQKYRLAEILAKTEGWSIAFAKRRLDSYLRRIRCLLRRQQPSPPTPAPPKMEKKAVLTTRPVEIAITELPKALILGWQQLTRLYACEAASLVLQVM